MDIKTKFGNRVARLRRAEGWSQERLAELSGLHRTYISDLERGRRNVALENIEKIAKAFELDIGELFKYDQD